jgi:hypothetical protein
VIRRLLLFASLAFAQPPKLPYLDWKACPFEGCSYREWTAKEAATVYNTWKEGRQPIGKLRAGEKVTGVTGVVITVRPGKILIDRDIPEQHLKKGDMILLYTYQGFLCLC